MLPNQIGLFHLVSRYAKSNNLHFAFESNLTSAEFVCVRAGRLKLYYEHVSTHEARVTFA